MRYLESEAFDELVDLNPEPMVAACDHDAICRLIDERKRTREHIDIRMLLRGLRHGSNGSCHVASAFLYREGVEWSAPPQPVRYFSACSSALAPDLPSWPMSFSASMPRGFSNSSRLTPSALAF